SRLAVSVVVGVTILTGCQHGSHQRGMAETATPPKGPTIAVPSPSCPTAPGRHSQAELAALRPQVEAVVAGDFYSLGTGANAIEVDLRPGREALAAALAS